MNRTPLFRLKMAALAALLLPLAGCVGYDDWSEAPGSYRPGSYGNVYAGGGYGYGYGAPGWWGTDVASVDLFYDPLSRWGYWASDPYYGRVWYPSGIGAGWRPYMNGYWGGGPGSPRWMSSEPFGWATYHYGRWGQNGRGWFWVPGRTYSNGWVSWRDRGPSGGWAPLPPTGWDRYPGRVNGGGWIYGRPGGGGNHGNPGGIGSDRPWNQGGVPSGEIIRPRPGEGLPTTRPGQPAGDLQGRPGVDTSRPSVLPGNRPGWNGGHPWWNGGGRPAWNGSGGDASGNRPAWSGNGSGNRPAWNGNGGGGRPGGGSSMPGGQMQPGPGAVARPQPEMSRPMGMSRPSGEAREGFGPRRSGAHPR